MIRHLLRNIFLLSIGSFICSANVMGQIIIDQTDMPVVNDTFRLSSGIPNPLSDPAVTGPNHVWDYSWLIPFAQNIDTFRSVSSTGALYAFFFVNNAGNVNRANLATKGPVFPSVAGVSITDVVSFMYNSTASYKQVGIGANLNGATIPIAYAPHDIVYKFPMNYGNIDSSNSAFSLALTGLGYYGYTLKRNNEVDGWGNLTTPFGTFQTLRVKSTLIQKDTLYVDSLATGFGIDRPLTIEYKWLADNKGVPLLTVITQDAFGGPMVTSITYRDSARAITIGTNDIEKDQNKISLYPNPSNAVTTIEMDIAHQQDMQLSISDIQGRELHRFVRNDYPAGRSRFLVDANTLGLSSGIYFIQVQFGNSYQTLKWMVNKE